MIIYELFLFTFINIILQVFNQVLASNLEVENILNGREGDQSDFKYAVEIVTARNFSEYFYSLCGGAIVADNAVISAAHCFLDFFEDLKKETILVVAGVDNYRSPESIIQYVHVIYWGKYDNSIPENDIALLKLKSGLGVGQNSRLSKLLLPESNQSFHNKLAVVIGFGDYKVDARFNELTGQYEFSNGETDNTLRFGKVRIATDKDCKNSYPLINNKKQLCGIMIPFEDDQPAGICNGDSGSPLVFNNVIVGIVSRGPRDCDDTFTGAIYTKISAYVYFIRRAFDGNPLRNTNVYYNRLHVKRNDSTESSSS